MHNYFRSRQSKVGISKTFGGEEQTYTSYEVTKIVYPPSEKDTSTVVYEAVTAMIQKAPLAKQRPTAKPVFMRLVYNGKNEKGMPLHISTLLLGRQ